MSKLLGLQYTVLYQKGSKNLVADALSRQPSTHEEEQCVALSVMDSDWNDRIQLSVAIDGKLQALIDSIKEDPSFAGNYQVQDGMLLRKGKRVVGDDKVLKQELIKFFHANAMGGHYGVHATS